MVRCKNCIKNAYYNNNEEDIPLYCKNHKLENMINIKRKKCIHENCKQKAYYNKKGLYPKYCSYHKLENMINVIYKICIYQNCTHIAHYNNYGKSPIYCSDHKLDKMINVSSKKCIFKNCIKSPSYNYKNIKSPKYCIDHKLENMIYQVNKQLCISKNCNKIVTSKYNGYCPPCYTKLNPNKLLKTRTKEYNVINNIISKFNIYDWKINEKIQLGSSNRRPDLLLKLKNYTLIIEINEYQHKRYISKKDENERILEISNDLNNKPLIIINFNPDNYRYNNKNKKSCWEYIKGYWMIKESKKEEWNRRLYILELEIQKWIISKSKLDENIKIINLYYDNYIDKIYNTNENILNIKEPEIYYFSDLSSDTDDNIKYKKEIITKEPNIYYFSDLSSNTDDDELLTSKSIDKLQNRYSAKTSLVL